MNESKMSPSAIPANENDEIDLVDFMIVLVKHKKLLIGLPLIAALIAAAVSFTLPETYKATAKLLPPQQSQSGASALLAQFGGMASMAAGVAGLKNPSDLYVGMLKSRTVADRLIAQYDLKKAYHTEWTDNARKKLSDSTTITSGKDGLITIEVEDMDKQRVARLTNSYIDELLRLNRQLAVTGAAQQRLFFEQQLRSAKDKLAEAEIALKGALETHGVISVDVESRAAVETLARLRAQISSKEIEINAMRAFLTSSHPQFLQAKEELSSLRAQLSKLENGQDNNGSAQRESGVSSEKGGLESIQRFRDLKYYQMLYELLAKQYEAARLEEAKDPSIVQVLDPAIEPERRASPKRTLIVLGALIAGFAVAFITAFLLERKTKTMVDPVSARKWAALRAGMRRR